MKTLDISELRVGGDGQVWKWCGPVEGQRRVAHGGEVHELQLPKNLPLEWQWLVEKSKIIGKLVKPAQDYRKTQTATKLSDT